KNLYFLLIACTLFACTSTTSEKPRPSEWHGNWKARWETLPESYPGIENMEFYMNGNFTFTSDSLTVKADGFDGCIFNTDTLIHTQSWYVSNDTLFLLNDPELVGMTYKVKSKATDKIELQLMEDIFVTLEK
ncbi:MAG: hypothetical protein AAGA66_20520, partial [Bacteroidota bacterium]